MWLSALCVMAAAWLAAPSARAAECGEIASLALPAGAITSAEIVAPGAFRSPGPTMGPPGMGNPFASMPAFCRVQATLRPSSDSDIKIEVWMPVEGWNGKFLGVGNGVWAGTLSYGAMAEPVTRGFAVATTDTGHTGNGMTAEWAIGHPERLVDFGHRAVHEMAVNGRAIVAAYYGSPARVSLWASCSTGGRQGLMAAYRYPEDFDVISAMAPANPMTDLMVQSIWSGYAALRAPENALTPQKLAAVNRALVQACDASDGAADGLVNDPTRCAFDPASVQCEGADGPSCLTAAQVATVRALYEGPPDPDARSRGLGGFTPGSEAQMAALTMGPQPFPAATSYMRDLVVANPSWDFRSFDYERDSVAARQYGTDILDVRAAGLDRFFARGGKLLLSHGWADGLIPAGNTVAFYADLTREHPEAAEQMRLFMAPGVGHCAGGDGPSQWDAVGVIDRWQETSVAPERIIASQPPRGPDAPARTRPWCAYPLVARYDGEGDVNDAENFICAAPS